MRIKLILSLTGNIIAFFGLTFLLPIAVGLFMGEQTNREFVNHAAQTFKRITTVITVAR